MYLLMGRFFSMIPFAENIGLRVNLVSGLTSALTVLIVYLTIVRIIRAWRGREETVADMIAVYGSAAAGALTLAFSHSFWFNAVEAEVYAVSQFFTALVFYLALVWLDYAEVPRGNRILLFIFYVIGLSTGVHLLNILALISVTYIIAFHKKPATFKNFISAGLIGCAIIFAIYPGIIQGLPSIIKHFSVYALIPIFAVLVYLAYYFKKKDMRVPALSVLAAMLVIIGYSTYLLILIRSGLDPFLDENDPETWSGLLSYLNREQYGSESLFLTMFKRKAAFWDYQINKMYIRYFAWQFIATETKTFYAIPFLLGLIGAVHHFYRDTKGAITVFTLFIMTGLAVVFYLNQDDPQPRERDYAYVGSFMAFAIWIGIGVITLIELIQESFKRINVKLLSGAVAAVCLVAAPYQMFTKNFHEHDRSGNYVAWDYSYNLLQTCEPDAIIYTNGDNDTFPLWYLQVVEGVRPDVRVVNLSLLNTGWFIKQIRDKDPKVPMPSKISDNYVDNVLESREINSLMDRHWQEKRRVSIDGPDLEAPKMVWDVPATMSFPAGPGGKMEYFLKVQDLMILNTMAANRWEKPIYFAVTVPDGNLIGLRNVRDESKNYLTMEGLAFRLYPHPVPLINAEHLAQNMFKKYQYRGTNDPEVFFNDNILKLLGNYRQGVILLAYHFLQNAPEATDSSLTNADLPLAERIERFESLSQFEKALTALEFIEDRIPEELVPINYDAISLQIGEIYDLLQKPEGMKVRLDRIVAKTDLDLQRAYEFGLYYLSKASAPEDARRLFDLCLEFNTSLENYQRIAYSWLQLGDGSNYPTEIFNRYLELNNDRNSKLQVASQGLYLGLDDLAFSIYDPLWRADPGDKAALTGLVEYYQRKQDYQRALTLTKDWLGAYPTDSVMISKRVELEKLAP